MFGFLVGSNDPIFCLILLALMIIFLYKQAKRSMRYEIISFEVNMNT